MITDVIANELERSHDEERNDGVNDGNESTARKTSRDSDQVGFSDAEIEQAQEAIQTIYEQETRIIVEEDVPIVESLNYQTGGFLVPADRQLATYLRYVHDYPRIRMAELIQSAEDRIQS